MKIGACEAGRMRVTRKIAPSSRVEYVASDYLAVSSLYSCLTANDARTPFAKNSFAFAY